MQTKNLCVYPGEILIPSEHTDLTAWACIACDQYTSQPEYWEEAKLLAGDRPSALNVVLPECYLGGSNEQISRIHETMQRYLADGVLTPGVEQGFILTERSTGSGARVGLVCLLDLECYDYHRGSQSLVRATEGTVESRIPPRMAIREGAALETSHVMLLMDDPMQSVVEPLFAKRDELDKLYDFPLMMHGGHLTGYAVSSPEDIKAVYTALDGLRTRSQLLFAVGDGNHSLAAAKAYWEKVKSTLTPEQTATHPARFALVEIENIHDDALQFEPIHRVLFGYDGDDLLDELSRYAVSQGASIVQDAAAQEITVVYEGKEVRLGIDHSPYPLAVGTLEAFLSVWMQSHPTTRLDYIHGDKAVRDLVKGENAIGFLLPALPKDALFPTVEAEGALPPKTFSMGSADEKRFYMECRRLQA
ncbi:MAG: DUF1015 domain-containing protein [Eubacteriales bacterium]|nr:DUF1015 domain-containing protein [Eubacteriales bacterium]